MPQLELCEEYLGSPSRLQTITSPLSQKKIFGAFYQLVAGVQNSAMNPESGANKALHIAGAIVEKGLKTLKSFVDLVPAAPGLSPALEVVCGCIEVYE